MHPNHRSAAKATIPALLVPLLAVVFAAVLLAGCTTSGSGRSAGVVAASTGASTGAPADTSGPSTATRSTTTPVGQPVHIQLKFSDGQTFGVGIPVIAFFSREITDATALQNATRVTINGRAVDGGRWYFEPVLGHPGYPLEGDYRLRNPWPAHAKIFVSIPAQGRSAGAGLSYDDSLTSSFATGAAQIATVSNATHRLTLTVDGRTEGSYPVSLGALSAKTSSGIKVIMEKGNSICMTGPGYHKCGVRFTQRLTYGGEYLHSAPWNCTIAPGCVGPANNIGSANSSNGCTNLLPADAQKLYGILRIGDIVTFPDADGPKMTMGAGYGDWNVPWAQWLTGGTVAQIEPRPAIVC